MRVCVYRIDRKVECDAKKEADIYEKCKSDLNSRQVKKKLQLLWGYDFDAISWDSGSNKIVDCLLNFLHYFDKM